MPDKKKKVLIALGKEIRRLRLERGFTQEGFAAAVGLDRAYYGGVERGERNLAAYNLVRIATVLEVEVGDLFPPREQLQELLRDNT